MNTKNSLLRSWLRRIAGLATAAATMLSLTGTASAKILFEDDTFFNVNSEGIILDTNNDIGSLNQDITLQLGNDGTDAAVKYNGSTGDITLSTPGGDFSFSDDNLTTTGKLLFQNVSEYHLREVAGNPNTVAACTTLDEVVLDTTGNTIYICTATGAAGVATWTAPDATTLDGLDSSQFLRSDTSDSFTSGTLTFNAGTILDVNGGVDFSGATSFLLYQGGTNPGTCTEGEIFYNTGDNTTYICTAANTWTGLSSGNPDFEAVYSVDADDTLTTSNGNFTIAAGTGAINFNSTNASGISLNNSVNGPVNIGTGTSTGTVTLGGGSGDVTINGKVVGISSNGAGNDVTLTSADDIVFDDAQLTGIIQMTATATDWDITFSSDGIIDNINSFASTANGEGASNVGIEDSGAYFAGTTVEAALQELGLDSSKRVEDLTFYPEYPDTVVYADGTNNRGTLESFYDSGEVSGYYNWTSTIAATQDIDLRFDFPIPQDFAATGDFTYRYRTGTTTEADNDVEITLYNVTDAATCASDLTNGTAGTWATGTIVAASINAGCAGLSAGDVVEVRIKLYDNVGAADYADVGRLIWNYTK